MALDKSDIEAIRLLLREEIKPVEQQVGSLEQQMGSLGQQITDFRTQVDAQFNEVQSNFEGLYARDEKREQEYLALNEQIKRHDERIESVEKKVA